MGLHIYIILLYIMVRLGGFQLHSKRADPEPEQAELIFVAPPAPPSHPALTIIRTEPLHLQSI